jgi:aspartyl-tRNA(Asn)/glutamyl-tRNA(Gln) amidotransferase subunit A
MNENTRRRFSDLKAARFRQQAGSSVRVIRKDSPRWLELSNFPTDRRRQYPSLVSSATDWTRTIGVPTEYNIEELSDSVREAWNRVLSQLETQGHTIVPISLPTTKAALSAYYVLAPAEASSNLAKYDGIRYGTHSSSHPDQTPTEVLYSRTRGAGFGPEVKRRILLGTYSLSSEAISNYFIQAQKIRRLVQRDFDSVFKLPNPLHHHTPAPEAGVDYIVCPTAPTPPPKLTQMKDSTPIDAYMNDVFTVPASLAGLPAISVPAPLSPDSSYVDYANVGIQVIGQYGDDESVMRFVQKELQATWGEIAHYKRRRKKRFL